jgi:hypothetical protein
MPDRPCFSTSAWWSFCEEEASGSPRQFKYGELCVIAAGAGDRAVYGGKNSADAQVV